MFCLSQMFCFYNLWGGTLQKSKSYQVNLWSQILTIVLIVPVFEQPKVLSSNRTVSHSQHCMVYSFCTGWVIVNSCGGQMWDNGIKKNNKKKTALTSPYYKHLRSGNQSDRNATRKKCSPLWYRINWGRVASMATEMGPTMAKACFRASSSPWRTK